VIVLEANGLLQRSLLEPALQFGRAPADLVHRQPYGSRRRAGKRKQSPVDGGGDDGQRQASAGSSYQLPNGGHLS